MALSLKRVEGYRNFANKLWNAARYALMKLDGTDATAVGAPPPARALPNRWILSRLAAALEAATKGLEDYRLDEASGALYHFVWDELCDWYLELSKPLLDDAEHAAETRATLVHVLEATLRALHPMMPFITEEIWQRIPKDESLGVHPRDPAKPRSLIVARFPTAAQDGRADAEADDAMETLQAVVKAARTIRAEHDLPRSAQVEIHYHASDPAAEVLSRQRRLVEALVGGTLHAASAEQLADPHAHFPKAAVFATRGVKAAMPDVIDTEREQERLRRALKKLDKELSAVSKKLDNPHFVEKAPPAVVEKSRADRAHLQAQRDQLQAALDRLG